MSNLGLANVAGQLKLGGGAQFWAYISPQNDTAKMITNWEVTISQGNWSGTITSKNPTQQLQTPGLSGIFNVSVKVLNGSTGTWRQVPVMPGSNPDIGCNKNCAAMVVIVADSTNPMPGSINAHYSTTWDALCTMS